MGGAGRTLDDFGKNAEHAHGGVGRLNNAMANMAAQVAGVNPILGKATEIIASLGLGGAGVVTGALAGLALLAFAWDTLTKSAREAGKAQDEAITRLAKTAQMKAAGPGGQTTLDVATANAKLQKLEADRRNLINAVQTDPLGIGPNQEARLESLDEEIARTKDLIRLGGQWIAEATAGANAHKTAIGEVVGKYNELRDAAAKVNAENLKTNKDWWRNYIEKTNEALTLTEELRRARNDALPTLVESFGAGLSMSQIPDFQLPKISLDDGVTKEQRKNLESMGIDITGNATQNADRISNAILTSASVIVGALNIGGGGKGSSIGSALGGAIGGAAMGGRLGAYGGPIGAVVGALAGSLLGGLFDHHKKAVDTNTQALRENTAALLLNTPSGYKVAAGRFDATNIKEFRRAAMSYATRGGAPVMTTP